jgi:hypothetical protein
MEEELDKVATPRGQGRSMTSLSPYQVAQSNVNFTYTGSDWMGPLPPMAPIAPKEVAGRTWDYIPGYNLATQPRTFEQITFESLRMLSHAYDPVRLIIERRKDQMARMPWVIRVRHDGSGRPPTSAQLSPQKRALIADITNFFRHPYDEFSFRDWMRMIIEDLLVLDAPSLFCERDDIGNLVALSPIDGGTIKPVMDERGRLPRPFRWNGQPFVWCGETVNLDNYQAIGCRIANGLLYVPAFQQILKGLPAVGMTTWDLVYKPMNMRTRGMFGFSPVEQIATTITIAMRRTLSQLEYYKEGNQPDAIYGLPETFGPDQIQRLQDWWDNVHAGNLGARRKMKFLPGGTKSNYVPLKEPALKGELDEWLTRIVCFAFSYPPSAFVSLSNRSIAEAHEKQAEEEGLGPLKEWFSDMVNGVVEREFSEEVQFAFVEEQVVDQKVQSEVFSTYVQNAIFSINEIREKLGEQPDPSPAANTLMAMTKTGFVPIGERPNEDDEHGVA